MIQAGFRSQEVNPAKLVQLYRRELGSAGRRRARLAV